MKSVVFLQNVDVFSTFDEFSMGILLDAKCISDWTGSSNLTENEQYSHFQCDMQCINANTEWTVRVLEFFCTKICTKLPQNLAFLPKATAKIGTLPYEIGCAVVMGKILVSSKMRSKCCKRSICADRHTA